MQSKILSIALVILMTAAMALGCGGKAETPTAPRPLVEVDEPKLEFETFEVMAEAGSDRKLPLLLDAGKRPVEAPCFERVRKPQEWATQNPAVLQKLEENRELVTAAVLAWYKKVLFPKEMWGVDLMGWTVDIAKPVVRHVPPEKMSFAPDQTCITADQRNLPSGAKAVTTLFGATEFLFRSDTPLDRKRIKSMKAEAKKRKWRLVPVNAYTRATDDKGEPKVGERGEKLFNSPTGALIPEKSLPLPKERLTVEWKLILPKAVYFAFGDLPSALWRREQLPDACEVFLVFDDAVPQVPECAQFQRVGFGAKQAEDPNTVIIKAANQEATYIKEVPFNETALIQVGGRIITWVTPLKIEEGARLKIDSLVLKVGDAKLQTKTFPPSEKKRKKPKKK